MYQGEHGSLYANPHAVTSVANVAYTYDNNGNLLGNGSATSTWDYANRISSIALSTSTLSMSYDHSGQRVKYQVGTSTIYYPNQYFDATATTTKDKHIYANNLLIASVRGLGTATSTYYVHTDHLGGSGIITDASSTLNELNDYYPFGEVRTTQKQTTYDESKKFTGHEYDAESSLNYMNARYQDGRVGRFVSEDPVFVTKPEQYLSDPQQANSYAYGRNNPIRLVDLDGKLVSDFQSYLPNRITYQAGDLLGKYINTNIYSHGDYTPLDASQELQCTSFVNQFSKDQFNVNIGTIGDAVSYGNQANLNQNIPSSSSNKYTMYKNGGSVMPQENDIISWSNGKEGHVGIVAEVVFDKKTNRGQIYTVEQNVNRNSALFVQPLTFSNGSYSSGSRMRSYTVQGWARYGNQSKAPIYSTLPMTPAPKTPIKK